MNHHHPKDKDFLWIALLLILGAMLLLVMLLNVNRASAGCLRPVTETARITSVSRTLPALYLGVGVNTGHGVAFYSWRHIPVGARKTVVGCLDGDHIDVIRVY